MAFYDRSSGLGDQRSGDWTCPKCGANCFASRDSCFRCHARKEGVNAFGRDERPGPEVRPGDWKCTGCGANVFASKDSCYKCGQSRDPQGASNVQGRDVRPGDWTCSQCSANVFASKDQCFKCGHYRGPQDGHAFGGLGQNMPEAAPKLFPTVYVSDIPRQWDTQTLQMMIDDESVVQIKLLPSKLDQETCCAMVRFRTDEAAEAAVQRLKGLPVSAGNTGVTKYLGARIANAPAKLPGQRWAMAKRMMGHPTGWAGPSSSSGSSSSGSSSSSSDSSSSSSSESEGENKKRKRKAKTEKAKKRKVEVKTEQPYGQGGQGGPGGAPYGSYGQGGSGYGASYGQGGGHYGSNAW